MIQIFQYPHETLMKKSMNLITLKVLHLIRECLNYDGTWQENSKEKR